MISPVAENITKKLIMCGLNRHVRHIIYISHDRIFYEVQPGFIYHLETLVHEDVMRTSVASGGPHDLIHNLVSEKLGGATSYRENKRPSLQVVMQQGETSKSYFGDADIDLGSPSMDFVSFITHMAELITPGPTDHFQLKKRVDKEYSKWKEQNA